MLDAKIEVQIVGEDIHPDITIKIEKPETLGNDRLIGAYEGYAMVQGAAIVIDLGTALTIDFVSSKNEFLGGIIAPGLRACAQSLETTAPLLAGYQLFGEVSLPGKNTGQAIRSGLVYLISGGIEKVVNEFIKLVPNPFVNKINVEFRINGYNKINKIMINFINSAYFYI